MINPYILIPAIGVGVIVGAYIILALTLYLYGNIEKDETGDLILDVDAWHFKLAYLPGIRKNEKFLRELEKKRLGLCVYCLRLFLMLIVGWPCIVIMFTGVFFIVSLWYIIEHAILIVGSIVLFMWGMYFHKANFYWPWNFTKHNNLRDDQSNWWTTDTIEFFHVERKTGKEFMFRPIYAIVPLLYLYSWVYHNPATGVSIYGHGVGAVTLITVVALVTVLVVGFVVVLAVLWWTGHLDFLKRKREPKDESKPKKISLVKEWLKSQANDVCPQMKVRTHLPPPPTPEEILSQDFSGETI